MHLKADVLKQIKEVGSVDVVVGILCKNVETTILHVLDTVCEGVCKYLPDYTPLIVVTDGFSSDRTYELANLFQPYENINKIVTSDMMEGGKGAGIRTVFEIAHRVKAKAVVLVDGDLLSIKPEWIQEFTQPILCGRHDLVVPYYIRDKYDGVITNHLAYPFSRAVYGMTIRQPIAGEFGISQELYEKLLKHPLFPNDFGIDIFVTTVAAAEDMEIQEGIFGMKLHESTVHYFGAGASLTPMFRQVVGEMFSLAKYYEKFWKKNGGSNKKITMRRSLARKPIPVQIDVKKLLNDFDKEYPNNKETYKKVLPKKILNKLEKNVTNRRIFDLSQELWAEIVYNFAKEYKKPKDSAQKRVLLDALRVLWNGRIISFIKETRQMDTSKAEIIIQKQAEIFEKKFDDFHSGY
jgi:glycosyltransferase involved in cell wall biosynthesis